MLQQKLNISPFFSCLYRLFTVKCTYKQQKNYYISQVVLALQISTPVLPVLQKYSLVGLDLLVPIISSDDNTWELWHLRWMSLKISGFLFDGLDFMHLKKQQKTDKCSFFIPLHLREASQLQLLCSGTGKWLKLNKTLNKQDHQDFYISSSLYDHVMPHRNYTDYSLNALDMIIKCTPKKKNTMFSSV